MAWIVVSVGALTVALGGVLVEISRRRIRRRMEGHDLNGVREYLSMLSRRGYHGGFLVFSQPGSSAFVQFKKRIQDGVIHLEMHYPRAPWSERTYQSVQAALREVGVQFEREPTGADPTVEFLIADFGERVEPAVDVTKAIFEQIFGQPVLSVNISGDGISPFDEVVRSTERHGARELWQRRDEIRRQNRVVNRGI